MRVKSKSETNRNESKPIQSDLYLWHKKINHQLHNFILCPLWPISEQFRWKEIVHHVRLCGTLECLWFRLCHSGSEVVSLSLCLWRSESQKPRQRVSNADRKVFANPESFCVKFIIGWRISGYFAIQNIQIICKVSGWTGKFPDNLKSVRII